MPKALPAQALADAAAAVEFAQSTRRYHARRTIKGSRQRESDIRVALDRLRRAMGPLRRAIARFPYDAQTDTAAANREIIYEASRDIQRERRKLWKMQKHRRPKEATKT